MIDCSIIVPVYYNEASLRLTFNEIHSKVIKQSNYTFELIFIDDGSGDNSFKVLLELKSEHPDLIKVIKLSRNFGQLSAILSGFSIASGENLVCISADLQDPPELILEFLEHRKNHQIVIAVRENRDEGFYRTATSAVFYWLMRKLALKNIPPGGFDYFLISSKIKDSILEKNEANAFFQGQILWTGFKPKFLPYRRRTRRHGKSRWTFFKKLKMLIDGVLAYSYLPIRLTSLLGLMISAGGFFYAILVIIGRITGRTPFIGYAPIII